MISISKIFCSDDVNKNSELCITDIVTCNIRDGGKLWEFSPAGKSRKMKSCFVIMDTRWTSILCPNGIAKRGKNTISVNYVIKINKDRQTIKIDLMKGIRHINVHNIAYHFILEPHPSGHYLIFCQS